MQLDAAVGVRVGERVVRWRGGRAAGEGGAGVRWGWEARVCAVGKGDGCVAAVMLPVGGERPTPFTFPDRHSKPTCHRWQWLNAIELHQRYTAAVQPAQSWRKDTSRMLHARHCGSY